MNENTYQSALSNYFQERSGDIAQTVSKERRSELEGSELLGTAVPSGLQLFRAGIANPAIKNAVSAGLDQVEGGLGNTGRSLFRVGRNVAGRLIQGESFEPGRRLDADPESDAPAPENEPVPTGPSETGDGIEMQTFNSESMPFSEAPPAPADTSVIDVTFSNPTFDEGDQADSGIRSLGETGATLAEDTAVEGAVDPTLTTALSAATRIGSLPGVSTAVTDVADAGSAAISSLADTATSAGVGAATSATEGVVGALGEATLESTALDETPIGGIITAGLGIATALAGIGEGIKDLFSHHSAGPAPAQVSFQAGISG